MVLPKILFKGRGVPLSFSPVASRDHEDRDGGMNGEQEDTVH